MCWSNSGGIEPTGCRQSRPARPPSPPSRRCCWVRLRSRPRPRAWVVDRLVSVLHRAHHTTSRSRVAVEQGPERRGRLSPRRPVFSKWSHDLTEQTGQGRDTGCRRDHPRPLRPDQLRYEARNQQQAARDFTSAGRAKPTLSGGLPPHLPRQASRQVMGGMRTLHSCALTDSIGVRLRLSTGVSEPVSRHKALVRLAGSGVGG